MLRHRRNTERQVALFMFGVILLVPPMLSVCHGAVFSFNVPLATSWQDSEGGALATPDAVA